MCIKTLACLYPHFSSSCLNWVQSHFLNCFGNKTDKITEINFLKNTDADISLPTLVLVLASM